MRQALLATFCVLAWLALPLPAASQPAYPENVTTSPFFGMAPIAPNTSSGNGCWVVTTPDEFENFCDDSVAGSHCCQLPGGYLIDIAGSGNQIALDINAGEEKRVDIYCNAGGFWNSQTAVPTFPFVRIRASQESPPTMTATQVFFHNCQVVGNDTASGELAFQGGCNWCEIHLVNPIIVNGFHQTADRAIESTSLTGGFSYIWSITNGSINTGGTILDVNDRGQFRLSNTTLQNSGTGGLCADIDGGRLFSVGNGYWGCDGFKVAQGPNNVGIFESVGDRMAGLGTFSGRDNIFQIGDATDTVGSHFVVKDSLLEALGYLGYADPQVVTEVFDVRQAAVLQWEATGEDAFNTQTDCASHPWTLTLFDGVATEPPPRILEVDFKHDERAGDPGHSCWWGTTFSANMLTQLANAPGAFGFIRGKYRDQLVTPGAATANGGVQRRNQIRQCVSNGGSLDTGTECCDMADSLLFNLTCGRAWNANTGAVLASCATTVASGVEFNALCN